ncbi:MAG: glycosyltransferase family 4 protein [Eubacterium sp.]|nr:glycosyltransferase family 4 protein [Eubacterium sp.]
MYKICFISTIPATIKGFILPTAKYLYETGEFEISVICSSADDVADTFPSYIHFVPVEMKRGASLDGGKVIARLVKIFIKEKFDLIQYSTPNASFYASIAGKIAKVPVRLYCQWGLAFEGFEGLKRKLFMLLEKRTCKNSTWIEPDSRGNLEYCRNLGFYNEEKSSVVLYGSAKGVDLETFDYTHQKEYREEDRLKYFIPEDAFVYGFVGALTGDKGINELISAFKTVSEKHLDAYLLFVGVTEKEYSLDKELFVWAQNNNNVIFAGHSTTVPKEMAAMDCYVTASYREGFGTTVIEASAMGLPVITSDIPGPTDIIKDGVNGLVVTKKSVEELAAAMEKMYEDRELCMRLGDKGLDLVRERYDQKMVIQAIYEDRIRLLEGK